MRAVPLLLTSVIALASCTSGGASPSERTSSTIVSGPSAAAIVRDAAGRTLGTLTIAETAQGLVTSGTLRGLPPGPHGIHLHAVGRCEAPFATAGGHWNPTSRMHGFDNPQGSHLGDMRNITVAPDSSVAVSVATRGGTLRGAAGLIDADGAAIVVHAGADDYRTDPAGNSGARVACGIVTP